jgi:NitT/TauT family transport system substrate-binding protein
MKSNLFSRTIRLACAAFITTMLAACTALQTTPPAAPLRVEFTQWWGDYTLLVAKEKGFFDAYNVNVEPVYYETFKDAYADLAAGQIDAALVSIGDAINISHHTPVRVVGIYDNGGVMAVVANPEIQFIRELRGKTVGTLIGTPYELLIGRMLATNEVARSEINLQNVNLEGVPNALQKNELQAAVTREPFTTIALNNGAHIIYRTGDTAPLFPNVITFSQSTIDQRPNDISGFMQAWFAAVSYRLANPDETRQIAAKYTGIPVEQIPLDSNLKIFTYEDNVTLYNQSNPNSIFDAAQKNVEYLIASGVLSTQLDIANIITSQYFIRP